MGFKLDLYVSCITVTMVQLAYAYRVWISDANHLPSRLHAESPSPVSGKNRLVTSTLAFLTFSQFSKLAISVTTPPAALVLLTVVSEGMSILQQINGDVSLLHSVMSNAFGTAEFGSTVACDLLISASMAYYLNKRRSGIRKTENLVDRLIVYVIGIGLLTSIFAIIVFVTWVALPKQLIFLTFYSIISKLYVNSLLVTLNARSGFRPKNNTGNLDRHVGFEYRSFVVDSLEDAL
ncbi:hypothetical protein CCMSSC00406_0007057 [Pleurotus cornucopiae]|uniref:Uncharacterized protein n=1 Tax=Pleurotus cornucopiae TaxID=5321 RepID=A0ACB7J5I9_PLECO|nr:hypothetical protein CCMSSC00406_0007057 [Pleurotus cornucopiae]